MLGSRPHVLGVLENMTIALANIALLRLLLLPLLWLLQTWSHSLCPHLQTHTRSVLGVASSELVYGMAVPGAP